MDATYLTVLDIQHHIPDDSKPVPHSSVQDVKFKQNVVIVAT